MAITKFRSVSDAGKRKRVPPGTPEFSLAVRSVSGIAATFAPPLQFPPGVHKFRSIEEAHARKKSWDRAANR